MTIKCEVQFDRSAVPALVAKYKKTMPLEAAALQAGERVVAGDYSIGNLMKIIAWKSSRPAGRVRSNSEEDVNDALRLAVDARTDRAAMAVLLGLRGVQVAVASAILTTIDPSRFTVIDYRALEALGVPPQSVLSVEFYLTYLGHCRRLAPNYGVGLRDFDRALWQWSKNRDEVTERN